jgi:4-amino-4-deoxy-L-arabinose transferase-like glycosyltransferase
MPVEGALAVGRARSARTADTRRGRNGYAWGSIAATVGFLAITFWWVAQDRAVQYGGAAQHLYVVVLYHDFIQAGDPFRVLDFHSLYPPMAPVVGALGMLLGGMSVAAAVLAENLVYVPLLALGCYQTARLLAGPRAGLLAVLFALGAPLIVEQFHVFMLDSPETALVAVTVWLILASDRFARTGVSALAGAALGLAVLTKELAPLYVVGLLPAVLLRNGGWRNARGIAAFVAAALVLGAPWYLHHAGELGRILRAAGTAEATVPLAARPPLVSFANFDWYLWATLNGLLFVPLFVLSVVGVVAAVVRVVRARPVGDATFELLVGLAGAWLTITVMPHHDLRYTMPLIVYLAALACAWIVRLERRRQMVAVGALAVALVAAHLGASFGVGGRAPELLPGNRAAARGEGVPLATSPIVYASYDFLVAAPQRDGDVLARFKALRRAGVKRIVFVDQVKADDPWFEQMGLVVFAGMAGLTAPLSAIDATRLKRETAVAIRASSLDDTEPCTRLTDGSGVWMRLGDPNAPGARDYCPP